MLILTEAPIPISWERPSGIQSKQRRDMINQEISYLRDLIPISATTRTRLSQLQLMAIICSDLRRQNYFTQALPRFYATDKFCPEQFQEAMNFVVVMCTREGKVITINGDLRSLVGEDYEDLMSNGDNFFDMLDSRDRESARKSIERLDVLSQSTNDKLLGDEPETKFVSRMVIPKNARRNGRTPRPRAVIFNGAYLAEGHIAKYSNDHTKVDRVLLGTMKVLLSLETHKVLLAIDTSIFVTVHHSDMELTAVNRACIEKLGWKSSELVSRSWYRFVHEENLPMAAAAHRAVLPNQSTRPDRESRLALLRIRKADNTWVPCIVLVLNLSETECAPYTQIPVREFVEVDLYSPAAKEPANWPTKIVCIYQEVSEEEAKLLEKAPWVFEPPKKEQIEDIPSWMKKPVKTVPIAVQPTPVETLRKNGVKVKRAKKQKATKAKKSVVHPPSPISSAASEVSVINWSMQNNIRGSPEQNVPFAQPSVSECSQGGLSGEWDFLNVLSQSEKIDVKPFLRREQHWTQRNSGFHNNVDDFFPLELL